MLGISVGTPALREDSRRRIKHKSNVRKMTTKTTQILGLIVASTVNSDFGGL
jgi:hypothetical protein